MSLADIADHVEEVLGGVAEPGEFVTGVFGAVSRGDNTLHLANAGHLPPVLIRDGNLHEIDLDPVFPLGLGQFAASVRTVGLQPGDAVYAFSDGTIEARNNELVQLGLDTLFEILKQFERDRVPVQKICKDVLLKVRDHVGGPLRDDATLCGLRLLS